MADTYGKAYREDNADTTVKCWHIPYNVESGSNKNNFVVVVLASEMTDATDVAEAKTLANAKASTIKSNWVTALSNASTVTEEPTISGVVTL